MSYEFKVGDKGKMRGGYAYEVLAETRLSNGQRRLFVKYWSTVHGEDTMTIYGNGLHFPRSVNENMFDLMPSRQTRTIYANVYPTWVGTSDSEGSAQRNAGPDALAVAVPVTFEFTPEVRS